MATSLKRRRNSTMDAAVSTQWWMLRMRSIQERVPLYWIGLVLLLVLAVLMRLFFLNVPFDRDSYDEGVYWQSLRAMLEGQGLYHSIFYSQPPVFLLSTFPGFALFGGTLLGARLSIALISLAGFLGVYLLGKELAGRAGILVAILLLLVSPLYLAESQTIQAEAASVAFTLLATGLAFLWWRQPDGWRGICWAALTAIALALSILSKLLCITTVIPIAWLMVARIWQMRRGDARVTIMSWLPILIGVAAAFLTVALVLLPFASSFSELWSGVITFHDAAMHTETCNLGVNYWKLPPYDPGTNFLKMTPQLFSFLSLPVCYGIFAAFLRKDWRVYPLLTWLLVTIFLLWRQNPLFLHHLIVLIPPFIALAALGFVSPPASTKLLSSEKGRRLAPWLTGLCLVMLLAATVGGFVQEGLYYNMSALRSSDPVTQVDLRAAADLHQAISADQWVVTDGQFIAGLADRNTPPSLVDTSIVRFCTGYLTPTQLEQTASNPRVHAILFYTDRFRLPDLASFHGWVTQHFHLLRTYNAGQELWVR